MGVIDFTIDFDFERTYEELVADMRNFLPGDRIRYHLRVTQDKTQVRALDSIKKTAEEALR